MYTREKITLCLNIIKDCTKKITQKEELKKNAFSCGSAERYQELEEEIKKYTEERTSAEKEILDTIPLFTK